MTPDDHNLVPSERGELARSGGETHPILSEIAGDLVARANKKDEPVPQGSRIGDPKIMLYETSMGQSFHNVYIFGPLFWKYRRPHSAQRMSPVAGSAACRPPARRLFGLAPSPPDLHQ